jgi:hypothetical protein
MIAAALLAIYLLLFSAGHDQLGVMMEQYVKDPMKVVIKDERRRKQALQGLSVVNDDISDLNKQVATANKKLEILIKNYNSTPEEFDLLFSSTLAKREQQINQIWIDRQAMLTHIQEDEWRTIMSRAKTEAEKKESNKKK